MRKCLDSIAGQSYGNLEVILVDDGSTDGSGAICDEYAAKDGRFTVIHQVNGGVSKARNAGLKIATGDFYHFPDSDDYLELDAYEYLLGRIQEHDCDAVNFEYFVTYPNREVVHLLKDQWYGLADREKAHLAMMSGEPFAWNKFFSKALVAGRGNAENKECPPVTFREDIFRGEDSLFAHTALERGEKVWFDPRPLYHYVQSEQSACRGHFRTSQLSAMKLYDAYIPLLGEKYPKLLERLAAGLQERAIILYYDMWSDEVDYTAEQREIYRFFLQMGQKSRAVKRSKKTSLKLSLFRMSPGLFCRIHRFAHHL